MAEHADVAIVGGGVIGVCTAHALARRGVRPLLLERGEICSGCSHGNAGWIFPSHSMPLPAPGVMRLGLRWLFDRDSPLYVQPRASTAFARWVWAFRAACNDASMRRAYALRRELSSASQELYAKLAQSGLEFGYKQAGLLVVCAEEPALDEARHELALLEELGGRGTLLDARELREREPSLAADLAGGIFLPDDAHVTPGDFVRGLAREAERLGADLRTNTEVLHASVGASRTVGPVVLETTRGEITCDELVLAAGAWSPLLGRQLGIRLPVEAAKGYSITVKRPPSDAPSDGALILADAKVGVTPMGDTLRFAGTLELAGLDLRVNRRRVRAIERNVKRFLPAIPPTDTLEVWRGLRPLVPDDLPILGRAKGAPGLVLATGHGMSGISQGPITGELVAQLLCDEPLAMDLAPYSPDRFA